jgi:O-antigen ligase
MDYRLLYANVGAKLIGNNPLGVGVGTQVYYSVTNDLYQNRGLTKLWQWEPIHNLYLLIGSEIGLFGLLSFLAFLGIVSWRLLRRVSLEAAVGVSLLVAILVLGLFDHFLWDLQPGRLLLWLTIATAVASLSLPIKKTRP